MAEHSARAIAATINIVLREEFVKRENESRPTLVVPASCGNLFYDLRGHIRFVRESLCSQRSRLPPEFNQAETIMVDDVYCKL